MLFVGFISTNILQQSCKISNQKGAYHTNTWRKTVWVGIRGAEHRNICR